jgi:hypothetical protein
MPARETYDWYLQQVWPQLDDEVRKYLETQRRYMLTLRNEDERRRFVENVIKQVKEMLDNKV